MVAKAKLRLEGEDATGAAFRKALGNATDTAGKMKRVFGAAFAGISIAGVASIGKQAIAMGDELQKAGIKAGVGGRAISELAYAARLADVDLGSLSTSLRFMQTNLSEAGSGSKAARSTFDALGVTFEQLKKIAPDAQFELLGDRISQLKDPADRARAATELFGRAGADLLPLFEQGAAGIRKAREEAVKLGHSFSDEQLKRLADADDAVTRLGASFSALAVTLTAKVAPGFTRFFNDLAGLTPETEKIQLKIDELESQLGSGAGWAPQEIERRRKEIEQLRAQLAALDAFQRGIEARRSGAGRRGRGGTRPDGAPPGFLANVELEEVKVTAIRRFDFANALRGMRPEAIDATDLVDVRFDQFNAALLENTEGIADKMGEVFEKPFEEMSVYADQAARNMQDAFADFLFDPFEDGIKGMLKSFVDILRRMAAEAAAARVFENLFPTQKDGSRSFGFLGAIFGSIFGGGAKATYPGPPLADGTNFVPRDMPAFLHRGEAVVPAKYNMHGMGAPVVNITTHIDARGATADAIAALPEVLRRNNAEMERKIIEGIQRGRYRLA